MTYTLTRSEREARYYPAFSTFELGQFDQIRHQEVGEIISHFPGQIQINNEQGLTLVLFEKHTMNNATNLEAFYAITEQYFATRTPNLPELARLARVTPVVRTFLQLRWEAVHIQTTYEDNGAGKQTLSIPPHQRGMFNNDKLNRLLRWLQWNPVGSSECAHGTKTCDCVLYAPLRYHEISYASRGPDGRQQHMPKGLAIEREFFGKDKRHVAPNASRAG
jgi:hypothetical protein